MTAPPPRDDLTELLRLFEDGDRAAGEDLIHALYDDLRRIAGRHLARERQDHTLQPTALLHEAWLKLGEGRGREVPSRQHFLALASRVMRSLLVDHARSKNAEKRGGAQERLSLATVAEDGASSHDAAGLDVLALDEALAKLMQVDDEMGRLIELRYFAGATVEEAAAALGLAQRTAERRLRAATAWLHRALAT